MVRRALRPAATAPLRYVFPRAHLAHDNSLRRRLQPGQDGRRRVLLGRQQSRLGPPLPVEHARYRPFPAQPVEQRAVAIEVEAVDGGIGPGHDAGQGGDPLLQELF
jgi:hypothetical protein